MHSFDIIVVARNHKGLKTYQTQQEDITAAIQRACELKSDGQSVEVWDGIDRIYANYRDQPLLAS